MPKLDLANVPEKGGTGYPPQYAAITAGRFRKRLGDAGGLTQFGVNLCRLEPGSGSSLRHWHHNEDEFVYIVAGEVVLVEDGGETVLRPGDAATFKAGVANGHTLVNRGRDDALFLEVGTRMADEIAEYPDIDLRAEKTAGVMRFTHRDGSPF
ncbi:MAG: cupin domain-containing protein [Phyllobacteriaceae bacterium]|nr:cupin domain-containing protein [Phyllobacteriaceae bacterium]